MVFRWKIKQTLKYRLAILHKGSCPLKMLIILNSRTATSSRVVVLNTFVGGLAWRKSLTTSWLIPAKLLNLSEQLCTTFSQHIHAQKCPQCLQILT